MRMNYKIRFENDPNATAPAQRVFIEHTFDSDLNPRTFRVGTFGFGNFTHELEMDRSFLQVISLLHLSQTMRKNNVSYANIKGADKPAHKRSLVGTMVLPI